MNNFLHPPMTMSGVYLGFVVTLRVVVNRKPSTYRRA